VRDPIARDHLWQRNNNEGQSASAERPDRLTLALNWAQIGSGRWGFGIFFRAGASFGIEIHALLIAAFASK